MQANLIENPALRADIRRALAGHHYELDGPRLYVPSAKVSLGGVFETDVNGRDRRIDPNLFPTAALIDVLNVYFRSGTQRTAFYLAPFSNSTAPTADLTGATFTGTQGEFTNYSESARPAWTPPGSVPTTASIDNAASLGVFTISAASSTVWGFGLLTSQPKSDTTGLLVACALFSAARSGLQVGDVLNTKYTFSAADAG